MFCAQTHQEIKKKKPLFCLNINCSWTIDMKEQGFLLLFCSSQNWYIACIAVLYNLSCAANNGHCSFIWSMMWIFCVDSFVELRILFSVSASLLLKSKAIPRQVLEIFALLEVVRWSLCLIYTAEELSNCCGWHLCFLWMAHNSFAIHPSTQVPAWQCQAW